MHRSKALTVAAGVFVAVALGACFSEENPNEACTRALELQQLEAGTSAAGELERLSGVVKAVSDGDSALSKKERRDLRVTTRMLKKLGRDLDQAFNTGCV